MVRWKSENIFGSLWNCGGMELVSWLMHLLKECGHICPRPSPNVVWVINVRDVNIRFLTGSHAYCSVSQPSEEDEIVDLMLMKLCSLFGLKCKKQVGDSSTGRPFVSSVSTTSANSSGNIHEGWHVTLQSELDSALCQLLCLLLPYCFFYAN